MLVTKTTKIWVELSFVLPIKVCRSAFAYFGSVEFSNIELSLVFEKMNLPRIVFIRQRNQRYKKLSKRKIDLT